MSDFLSQPSSFTVAGILILLAGMYALARGASPRRRISFFQLSLAAGLWVVTFGTLLEPGAPPESLRASADLFVFLELLVATTAYQFVTHGLGFGRRPAAGRERRQGVLLMWGISAAVGMLLAAGEMELVTSVTEAGTRPALRLHWHAIPVVVAVWAGILSALVAAGRTWWGAETPDRSGRAIWVVAAVGALVLPPIALHTPLFGEWGTGAAGISALASALILAGVARLEPITSSVVLPHVSSTLSVLRDPVLAVERDGTIQAASDAFYEHFGYRRHQLMGKSLDDLVEDVTGSHLPLSALNLDAGKEGREVLVTPHRQSPVPTRTMASQLGHVDGEALPTLFFFDPPGSDEDAGSTGGTVDRWLRFTLRPEVPALALHGLDDGQFTAVNDQFLQLTGYARSDLLGRSASDLDLVVYANRWDKLLERVQREGHVGEVELEVRRGGGGVQHVEFYGALVSADDGPKLLILARDLTAHKEIEEKLRGQVLYDALTGLPNRTLFKEQLKRALKRASRHQTRVAVLFIDLDGFKAVNDTHGHAAGDQLLAGVAWRLYDCFRQMDTLCRYGGDEFLVLLEDVEDRQDAASAADRFRRHLEAPFRLEGGQEVHVDGTIGAAVSAPGQGQGEDLLRQADAAMYSAKRRGESPIRVYDPERDAGEMEQLSQADDLRKAIDRDELTLLYQPLVDLETERIVSAEALVRWRLPSGELRSPGEFLPLAEETGLVVPMSEWIFREAVTTALAWRKHDPGLKISVNVAAQHFREPSLRDTLKELLAETGLAPEALQLEITESAALRDTRAIDRLRELGVRVAVDDFGTGYSSLEYIRGLGVDGVKIDQVFVASLGEDRKDQAIVRAVLLMAEAFDLEVTAEGIETEEQLRWLRESGCHLGQGFYFSAPVSADEFGSLLSKQVREPELGEG